MSSVLDSIEFNDVPGTISAHSLRVFSLSTCAFCRKAQDYLKERGITFQYVYLDQLDFDLKREIKADLKARFDNIPVFPILVIDDEEAISGFVEEKWADRIGIAQGGE